MKKWVPVAQPWASVCVIVQEDSPGSGESAQGQPGSGFESGQLQRLIGHPG